MTYRKLKVLLTTLTEEQLDCDVSAYICSQDEYMPVTRLVFAGQDCDVLDENHPYLIVTM